MPEVISKVWETGVFGIPMANILLGLFVFVVIYIIRGIVARMVMRFLKGITKRTKTSLDDELVTTLEKPLRFILAVIGLFIALKIVDLPESLSPTADKAMQSLVVMALFWVLYNLLAPLSKIIRGLEKYLTKEMTAWLLKALKVIIVFLGLATILELWGIKIGPILAGLGLLGVAVALGAQDLFKNLIAGILILLEKRFNHGDWIRVDGVVEGTVEDVGFRSTTIRRFDKALQMVPNAQLSDNSLTNFSRMTNRRISWVIGVEYKTTVPQLQEIRDGIYDYLQQSGDFVTNGSASLFVNIDSFSASSIDVFVYCFTQTTDWGKWLEAKERLAYKVKEIVLGAGSDFAFPSRTLYVENGVPADAFVPPKEPTKNKAKSKLA